MQDQALAIAVEALKASEAFRSFVYDDSSWPSARVYPDDCRRSGSQFKVVLTGGTATVGYGETSAEIVERWWWDDMPETEAHDLLVSRADAGYYGPVRAATSADLNPNQWAALTSFAYNVGVGGYSGSTVRRVINAGGDWGGPHDGPLHDAFMMWTTGNVPGDLVDRRQSELDLFFTPWAGSTPGPGPTPARKVGQEAPMKSVRFDQSIWRADAARAMASLDEFAADDAPALPEVPESAQASTVQYRYDGSVRRNGDVLTATGHGEVGIVASFVTITKAARAEGRWHVNVYEPAVEGAEKLDLILDGGQDVIYVPRHSGALAVVPWGVEVPGEEHAVPTKGLRVVVTYDEGWLPFPDAG